MKSSYAEVWEELEHEAKNHRKPHALIRRIIPESSLDAFIGIEFPDERKMFALETSIESLDKLDSFPVFKGLEIGKKDSVTNRSDKASLFVILKAPRFADVFCVLIEDIATELLTVKDEEKALAIIITRLVEWQQFTEPGNQEGLSAEARRGLYGELYLMTTHLLPSLGSGAVFAWKGFSANQQDYYLGKSAVEVKTTKAKQHQKLKIASERQLDENFFDQLFLYHVSLDELPGNSNTLPKLIEHIRDFIKGDAEARGYFEDALFQVGYIDSHRKMYDSFGYEIREENLFVVKDEFPRILEKELRSGVGDVTYSVNVAECKHFSTELSDLLTLIQGAANG